MIQSIKITMFYERLKKAQHIQGNVITHKVFQDLTKSMWRLGKYCAIVCSAPLLESKQCTGKHLPSWLTLEIKYSCTVKPRCSSSSSGEEGNSPIPTSCAREKETVAQEYLPICGVSQPLSSGANSSPQPTFDHTKKHMGKSLLSHLARCPFPLHPQSRFGINTGEAKARPLVPSLPTHSSLPKSLKAIPEQSILLPSSSPSQTQ